MTEEEYQARILELESEVNTLQTTNSELTTNVDNLTKRNEKLLEHNNQLFLRVSTGVVQDINKPVQENAESLITKIINIF